MAQSVGNESEFKALSKGGEFGNAYYLVQYKYYMVLNLVFRLRQELEL